ncbi:hypothetical protein E2C01_060971 [Portunus trituberculatus]|uniref:Uncharacterized protein n=1 Tax=Portunus trituberculatus TaxID=210409 RepID=A0A5B7HD40_PORTR|nr:hypothetical protein [Portunus trituberculatus]
MNYLVHAWRFEFKLGGHTYGEPMQCESSLEPFCLCYPLFC